MHDEDQEKPAAGIKITDRRRFDSSGNERADEQAGTSSTSTSASNVNGAKREAPASKPAGKPQAVKQTATAATPSELDNQAQIDTDEALESEINFSSFVVSLATQALMQMGQMSPPPGVNIEQDLTAAKQTIDILQMLHSKTRGNLTTKEDEMISEILHSLKMGFVRSRGGQVGR